MNIPRDCFPRWPRRTAALIVCLGLLAACARSGPVEDLCAKAEAASAKDDFVGALDAYGAALKLDPKNPKATLGRIGCYIKFAFEIENAESKYKGEVYGYSVAVDDLTAYLKLYPDDADAYLLRAQSRRCDVGVRDDEEGYLKLQLDDLDQAIRLRPKNVGPYLTRAATSQHFAMYEDIDTGLNARAMAGLDAGIALLPDSSLLYGARADYFAQHSGHESNAIADYTKAIELAQRSQQPATQIIAFVGKRADSYGAAGENDRAFADDTKAIELARASQQPVDDIIGLIAKRADRHFKLGQNDLAVADDKFAIGLATAAKQTPHEIAVRYCTFAERYRHKDKWELALADFDQALLAEPGSKAISADRGECRFMLKHYEAAIADFTQAGDARAVAKAQHELNLSKGLLSFDEWFARAEAEKDEAKRPEMYAQATAAAQAEAQPDYLKLSDRLIEKGQYDLAPALLNQALQLTPDSKPVQARLHVCAAQRLWWKDKDSGQALGEIEAARKLDDTVEKIVTSLAAACHQDQFDHGILTPEELMKRASYAASDGNYEKAIADVSHGLDLLPGDDYIHFSLLEDRARYYRKLPVPDLGKAAEDDASSLPFLSNLIEANPKDGAWVRRRGWIYAGFHEADAWESAYADFKKAAELKPSEAENIKIDLFNIRQECLVLAQNTNDDALAEKLAKVAGKIVGDDAEPRFLIDKAEVFLKVQDYNGAVSVIDRLLTHGTLDSREKSSANAVKCRALMHLKDFDGVLAAFKEVDPASDVYVDVRAFPGIIQRLRTPVQAQGPSEHEDLCGNCSGMGWITESSGHYEYKLMISHEKLSEHTTRVTTTTGNVWVPEPHKLMTCPVCNGRGLVIVVR